MPPPQKKIRSIGELRQADEPSPTREEQAAQRGYERWKFRGFRKVATPAGIKSDVKGAQRDLANNPAEFPKRLADRIAGYNFQGGPNIERPAFTYPLDRSEVTPYRAKYDLQMAQDATSNRRKPTPRYRRP